MLSKWIDNNFVNELILFFIMLILTNSECLREVKKVKRKIDGSVFSHNNTVMENDYGKGRGFFPPGGLFSIGKVLNFFPVGGEKECQPTITTVARAGICINPYDCRQRDGRASGDCAHGFGVCCVFEVTCGGVVQNNLTYFLSPGFPELWPGNGDCNITIEKIHAGITQLRIDFVHFNIGQPNRTTGACDEDVMVLSAGTNNFTLCGQNHGQHVYYNLETEGAKERREEDDLSPESGIRLGIMPRSALEPRLWLLRLAQIPLAHAAPFDCLQYYTQDNGTITTFNYAINGRHLARQRYRACVRRNTGRCAVQYMPCDERSFRIGTSADQPQVIDPINYYGANGPGAAGGPGTGFYGPDGSFVQNSPQVQSTVDQEVMDTENDPVMDDEIMSPDDQTQNDEIEGSGEDPQIETNSAPSSVSSRIWNLLWPISIWSDRSQRGRQWKRWSPYAQHYLKRKSEEFRYYGYGNFGEGLFGYGRQRCRDRVTIPCDNEYFISNSAYGPGVCDPHHCGNTFCPGVKWVDCRVETNVSPFAVSVNFGPAVVKRSAEENIGMCLRYMQIPCDS